MSAGKASATTHPLVPSSVFAKVLRVHHCEEPSWHVEGGQYRGGLGWLDATWQRYRLPGFPAHADLATPQQQARAMLRFITVAEHGWWPDQNGCTGGGY
jgi:hypothetical protein